MTVHKLIKFACPYCGYKGTVVWGDDGAHRELITLSKGFHIAENPIPGARPVIICDSCNAKDRPELLNPSPPD